MAESSVAGVARCYGLEHDLVGARGELAVAGTLAFEDMRPQWRAPLLTLKNIACLRTCSQRW